jgi:hypothetical protein
MEKPTMKHETRLALLEQNHIHIIDSLEKIERSLDMMNKTLTGQTTYIYGVADQLRSEISKVNERIFSSFQWTLSTMFTLACAGAGVLAKGFGWL